MDLKLLFTLVVEKGVTKFQTFGDSMAMINYMWPISSLKNKFLKHIYDEIQIVKSIFNFITSQYAYKERNGKVDVVLSRARLQLDSGLWHVRELKEHQCSKLYHNHVMNLFYSGCVGSIS